MHRKTHNAEIASVDLVFVKIVALVNGAETWSITTEKHDRDNGNGEQKSQLMLSVRTSGRFCRVIAAGERFFFGSAATMLRTRLNKSNIGHKSTVSPI